MHSHNTQYKEALKTGKLISRVRIVNVTPGSWGYSRSAFTCGGGPWKIAFITERLVYWLHVLYVTLAD